MGTFIYGLPGDTPAEVRKLYRLSLEIEMDKAFFIPLTPLPGTPFWRPELWDASGRSFREFGFLPAVARGERRLLDWTLLASFALNWSPKRIDSYVRGLCGGDARKRRMIGRIFFRSTFFAAASLLRGWLGRSGQTGMIFPGWYDK